MSIGNILRKEQPKTWQQLPTPLHKILSDNTTNLKIEAASRHRNQAQLLMKVHASAHHQAMFTRVRCSQQIAMLPLQDISNHKAAIQHTP
jgi:hypothetical protein